MCFRRPWAIDQLRNHAQAVLLVTRQRVGIQVMFRFELAQRKACVAVAQLMAQYAQRAEAAAIFVCSVGVSFGQLLADEFEELLLGILRVVGAKLLPLRLLRFLDKTQCILGVQGQFAVVLVRRAQLPAMGQQLPNDVVLKDALAGLVAHG